jgi:hypothetical protein
MTGLVLRSPAFPFSRHQLHTSDKRSARRRSQDTPAPLHCLPLLLPTNIAYRGVFPTSITDSPHHSTIFRHLAEPYRILEPQIYLRLPSEPFDGMFYSDEDARVATSLQLSNPENPSRKVISDVGRFSH